MSIFFHFLQIFMATLFLMTSADKIRNWRNHIISIKLYRILPNHFSVPILIIFFVTEIFISVSLLSHNITLINIVVAILLLLIYTTAVAINLIRNNKDISCGCGSIFESDRLHIGILYRNMLLVIILFFIYFFRMYTIEIPILIEIMFFCSNASLLILMNIVKSLMALRVKKTEIFKSFTF
jgi:hypothetical protein